MDLRTVNVEAYINVSLTGRRRWSNRRYLELRMYWSLCES